MGWLSGDNRLIKAYFLFLGFLPVASISAWVIFDIDMSRSCLYVLIPGVLLGWVIAALKKQVGQIVLEGWMAGVVAVIVYDLSRVPFLLIGWGDFIPKIGDWVVGSEGNWASIGYIWRYAGNGGGMGIALFMLISIFSVRQFKVWMGVLYGLFVLSCLMITLQFPNGEVLLFKLRPLSIVGGTIGHIIYGAVLGRLAGRALQGRTLNGSKSLFRKEDQFSMGLFS